MTSETCEAHNHYLNGKIPAEIAENLKEFFPEDGTISYEEFLIQQESVYMSIQAYGKNNASTSGESSNGNEVGLQMKLDEALARSLQDLGDDFENIYISEDIDAASESRDTSSQATPQATPARSTSQNIREDDIDPDNMTYEELQSLGEAVGHESRGLPDELISRLPTFKYKTGFFSKKRTKEACVICFNEYEGGDRLITLPCAHRYHSPCITHWFKDHKTCPVCMEEVQDN